MVSRVKNEDAKKLFQKLSRVEVKHQDRIFNEYITITEKSVSREEFGKRIVSKTVEGDLTRESMQSFSHLTGNP